MKNTLVVNRLPPAEPFSCRMPERSFSPTPPSGTNFTAATLSSAKTSAFKTFLPATTSLSVCLPWPKPRGYAPSGKLCTTTASAFPATFRHRADAVPQTSSWRRVMCATNSSGDISGNGSSTGFMRGSSIPSLMNTNKPPAAGRNTSCSNCLKLFCPKPSSSASSKTKRR